MRHTATEKVFMVSLKSGFNWAFSILSRNLLPGSLELKEQDEMA